MDKSKLPEMVRKSFPWSLLGSRKKPAAPRKKAPAATPKETQPGAMDDNALLRAKRRNKALKEANEN